MSTTLRLRLRVAQPRFVTSPKLLGNLTYLTATASRSLSRLRGRTGVGCRRESDCSYGESFPHPDRISLMRSDPPRKAGEVEAARFLIPCYFVPGLFSIFY